jgi:hypothetical protein
LLKIEIGGIMPTGFKHTAEEAEKLLDNIDTLRSSKYPSMKYEDGIYEVLLWLLEDEEKPEV